MTTTTHGRQSVAPFQVFVFPTAERFNHGAPDLAESTSFESMAEALDYASGENFADCHEITIFGASCTGGNGIQFRLFNRAADIDPEQLQSTVPVGLPPTTSPGPSQTDLQPDPGSTTSRTVLSPPDNAPWHG